MVPGKKYTPEDILLILRHRFWLVLIPFAIISAGTAAWARRLPNLYRSEATVLVQPPRVAESFVRSAVNSRIEDRLPAIQQQIMSRTRLERIITDLNLYVDERRVGIMEDIVERMRRAITVTIVKGDAFQVGFVGQDPRTVMKVADRLSSLFVEESMRDREGLVEGTDAFLESQLEEAKRRLIETEQKREQYRRQYNGELPTQIETNLQGVQSRQLQIQATLEAVDRDQERRLLAERQLAELESAAAAEPAAVEAASSVDNGTTAQRLSAARVQQAQMLLTLKPEHADVKRISATVAELEKRLETEALEAPVSGSGSGLSPAAQLREKRIADLRAQIEQSERQTARNLEDVAELRKQAGEYQRRAESGPTRETEMVELNRDYNTLQGIYTSLLGKKEESNIAANLERRQIGEQFKLVDAARLPERPFSPNRTRYNLMGMGVGIAFGLALVALLEYRKVSLHTDDEVSEVLGLPVLAVVPLMLSDPERQRRTRVRLVMHACFSGIVLVCGAVLAYTFLR